MNNIFSLSFSNLNFQIVHLAQNESKSDILSLNTYDYPSGFHFDQLFNTDQISSIAEIIKNQKDKANIDELSIFVSLPLNYSLQKKIALPLNVEQDVLNEQVEWELSHYLPGRLSDFKVIMTDSSFQFNGYKEVLFICVNKKIMDSINLIAQITDGKLRKLSVENFAVENFINKNHLADDNSNQILFNIDKIQMISHFYISGKYYYSYAENINPLKANTFNEQIVKMSKENYLAIKNLNEQLPIGKGKKIKVFIYGQALTNSLVNELSNSFSCPIDIVKGAGYTNINADDAAKYVEALGSCC